jgi:hypothetical protein
MPNIIHGKRTYRPRFQLLDLIIDFIYQGIPIEYFSTTLLKVRRLDYVLQQHGIELERIIRSPKRQQILGSIVLNNKSNISSQSNEYHFQLKPICKQ